MSTNIKQFAGGTWQVVEGLIKETLIAQGIDVFVYDLKE